MKPTDPTPEEYTKWIMDEIATEETRNTYWLVQKAIIIITEIYENCSEGVNKLYFNECLTELKKP